MLAEASAIQAMRLFRATLEDIIAADDEHRNELTIFAKHLLNFLCADCGALIEAPLRHRNPPECYCLECLTPPGFPLERRSAPTQDDNPPLQRIPPDDGIPF